MQRYPGMQQLAAHTHCTMLPQLRLADGVYGNRRAHPSVEKMEDEIALAHHASRSLSITRRGLPALLFAPAETARLCALSGRNLPRPALPGRMVADADTGRMLPVSEPRLLAALFGLELADRGRIRAPLSGRFVKALVGRIALPLLGLLAAARPMPLPGLPMVAEPGRLRALGGLRRASCAAACELSLRSACVARNSRASLKVFSRAMSWKKTAKACLSALFPDKACAAERLTAPFVLAARSTAASRTQPNSKASAPPPFPFSSSSRAFSSIVLSSSPSRPSRSSRTACAGSPTPATPRGGGTDCNRSTNDAHGSVVPSKAGADAAEAQQATPLFPPQSPRPLAPSAPATAVPSSNSLCQTSHHTST